MLCSLATNQCNINRLASLSNASNDVCDALRVKLSSCNVVGHKQAASAGYDDVVNHHANQVLPDGVVLIDGLSDGNFGANAIGRGGKNRVVVVL